jgi:spore coat polysaccharide biosynthesis protein SpsF
MEDLNILLITQARVGSSRFPQKVTKEVAHTTLLGLHLERVKKAKKVTKCVVATTFEEGVEFILEITEKANVAVFQGSLSDVLDRFYHAALPYIPDYVVRVTSDCPLLDPTLIDEVIEATIQSEADYGANIVIEEFPDGQDVEVFSFKALEQAWLNAKLGSEREHVTPYIRNNTDIKGGKLFKGIHYAALSNFNHVRMTVDQPVDLETIDTLVRLLGTDASWLDYTHYIIHHIDEFSNQDIQRNEGYLKSLINEQSVKL